MKKNRWKQKFTRPRQNPETQTTEKHEHAVYRSWCPSSVEGRGAGSQHTVALVDPDEEERENAPTVAFACGFMTQEGNDTFSILCVEMTGVWSDSCDVS